MNDLKQIHIDTVRYKMKAIEYKHASEQGKDKEASMFLSRLYFNINKYLTDIWKLEGRLK